MTKLQAPSINLLFLGALALLFSAAALWRLSPEVVASLPFQHYLYPIKTGQIQALSSPSPLWLLSLPILLIATVMLRAITTPFYSTIQRTLALNNTPQNTPRKLYFATFTILSLGTYLAAYILEAKKLLNTHSAAIGFVIICLTSVAVLILAGKRATSARPLLTLGEKIALVVGVVLAIATMTFDLNSWRYSFIGDEYSFFWSAQGLLTAKDWARWLEASGVYSGFPEVTTILQAITLVIFGNDNFGWKMSCVLATALCLPPLYVSLKWIASHLCESPRLCAALGSVLFFSMEPVQIWARIGKPHAFFLPPIIFTLGALARAQATGRIGWYGIAGLISGLGCFLSPVGPSLAIGSFAVLQGVFFLSALSAGDKSFRQLLLIPSVIFALGATLGAAPILVQRDYFDGLARLNLESPEAIGNRHLLVQKTVQSLFSFLSHDAQGHFMVANPFNLIVATLILGCFLIRGREALIWLSSGVAMCVGYSISVGGLSQYTYPPPSRIHLLAIPFCVLATIGISQLLRVRTRLVRVVLLLACVATVPLTLIKITLFNPTHSRQTERILIVRALQQLETEAVVVLLRDNDDFIKRIISSMQLEAPPKQRISYINNTSSLSKEELSAKLAEVPEGAGLVIPESLATSESLETSLLASDRVKRYRMWDPAPQDDNLPLTAREILKFLEWTEG